MSECDESRHLADPDPVVDGLPDASVDDEVGTSDADAADARRQSRDVVQAVVDFIEDVVEDFAEKVPDDELKPEIS